ncbi:type II secretory pathway pseudopilin PulG [Halanaerobium saccharolyticum]|uniref:Type II secretory pathway pseudopilin PulG n=1 Tax=Halanaerobium saccharolyticum TaxID=43595 RepID=A0A4R7YYK0_9FIRM|nr:type II secretion system protein [Halanaerobium saccharolyticum]RAK06712.1 type II secretory pathway pseudopilin PulG [Halanaerobium saccharolyticum]TDW01349.1 type II secretory pathway pseudopilin PulG [Halanaerobium saccharolyticum]TDX52817.1 type II secretory pathway pseudopilin PulG [Halanaerobium saccharolyticum]
MKILKNNQGFTLVEVILAFTIIILLITTFAGAVLVGLRSERTTRNIDLASSMSASIFDYLANSKNLKNIINSGGVDLSSGSYSNDIRGFIEGDLDTVSPSVIKDQLSDIFDDYLDNNRFNYLEKSEIEISDSEIIDDLYNIKLTIFWAEEEGEGTYEIETMMGAD